MVQIVQGQIEKKEGVLLEGTKGIDLKSKHFELRIQPKNLNNSKNIHSNSIMTIHHQLFMKGSDTFKIYKEYRGKSRERK